MTDYKPTYPYTYHDGVERVHLNPHDPTDPYQLYGHGPVPKKKEGTIRIWVDGCFDMLHFGHTNAIRQARALGAELFVGCHSDAEIVRVKGPPIMLEDERYEALRNCKWVDYVVENYPYSTRLKDLALFEIDYVAHGDDMSVDANGVNSYQEIIDAGKMKIVKRTDGISTTDLVGRMLLCTSKEEENAAASSPFEHYLTTTRKIVQFSNNSVPKPTDKVVYVDGSFDLFHIGHMRMLEQARKEGSYVIVGIHEDTVVRDAKGKHFPIMDVNERALGVLSCRFVDEVILGVPYTVTKNLIKNLEVKVVLSGKIHDARNNGTDPYAVPREMGILKYVESGSSLTTDGLIERVMENRQAFLDRQAAKKTKDKSAEENKPIEYQNVREEV